MEDIQPFGYPEEPDVYTICDILLLNLLFGIFDSTDGDGCSEEVGDGCCVDDDDDDDAVDGDDDCLFPSLFLFFSDIFILSWVVNCTSIRCWILLLVLLLLVVVAVAATTASITSLL